MPERRGDFPAGVEAGGPAAAEALRPWLEERALEMVPDRAMAALAAQQVLVDLQARPPQLFHSEEDLERWLMVRLTQTAALFTGVFAANSFWPRASEAAAGLGAGVALTAAATSSRPGLRGTLAAVARRVAFPLAVAAASVLVAAAATFVVSPPGAPAAGSLPAVVAPPAAAIPFVTAPKATLPAPVQPLVVVSRPPVAAATPTPPQVSDLELTSAPYQPPAKHRASTPPVAAISPSPSQPSLTPTPRSPSPLSQPTVSASPSASPCPTPSSASRPPTSPSPVTYPTPPRSQPSPSDNPGAPCRAPHPPSTGHQGQPWGHPSASGHGRSPGGAGSWSNLSQRGQAAGAESPPS